jgi:hypothetical protein
MPIRITNKTFSDIYGSTLTYLKANVGDFIQSVFTIEESISVDTSSSNTLQNNGLTNIITWIGGDFEAEGFRSGQTIDIVSYTISTGVTLASITTTVTWAIDSELKVATTLGSWYSLPDEAVRITAQASREGMQLDVNFVGNGSQGSEYSLIDGEVTTFNFDLTGTTPFSGVSVGNRSGMFAVNGTMKLISSTTTLRNYTLELGFEMGGLYNSANFDFNNCIKLYLKQRYQTLLGEPYLNTIEIFNDDADTGWFNEAHNTNIIDATVVQAIDDISYCEPTTVEFIIDSASTDQGFGGAYVSGLDSYYKVKPNTASNYSMLIPTTIMVAGQSLVSQANDETAKWFLETISIVSVGTQHTITALITPSPAFATFMANRSVGDRTFYFWCKFGNVNLLVFNGQLSCTPTSTQPLEMVVSDYHDHAENTTDSSDLIRGYTGNVEDDFAFIGKFYFLKKTISQFVNIKIQAYNITSEDSFTLQSVNFNLNGVPTDNTPLEAYIIDLESPVLTELPTTSVKRVATLQRDSSIDQAVKYGVKIYFPYIYRWETWIAQLNANSEFFPNDQTRNYVPYGNQDDWKLRLVIDNSRTITNAYGIQELVNYQYTDFINIDGYDHDTNIAQDIQLYIDSTSQNVGVITEGQLMRVVATHTFVDGSAWITDKVWGMITIEPKESAPRWLSSTDIDFDNNLSNPLYPLSGLRCDMTFPTPDVVRLECFFDPSKINLTNGVKFTSKIKGCNDGDVVKLATDGQQKLTTSGVTKIKT